MERNLRKTRVGIVTSDKMDKTVVVTIKNRVRHPLYNKIQLSTRHTTKTTNAVLAIRFLLWNVVHTARIRDGVWLKSLRRLNNRYDLQLF